MMDSCMGSHSTAIGECAMDQSEDTFNVEIVDRFVVGRELASFYDVVSLPDDILLRIFSYLNFRDVFCAMAACKLFRRVGEFPKLWCGVDVGNRRIHGNAIARIVSLGPRALRLCNTEVVDDWDERTYGTLNGSRLSFMDCSQFYCPDDMFVPIFEKTTQLMGLSLSGMAVNSIHAKWVSSNSNLRFLDMSLCEGLTAEDITNILNGCQNITELNVSSMRLGKAGSRAVCLGVNNNLVKLDLSGNSLDMEWDSVGDEEIHSLTTRCPYMVELRLADSVSLTEKCLPFLCSLQSLTVLDLSRCYGFHPMGYLEMSFLRVLSVFGCVTEDGLRVVREKLTNTRVNELEDAMSHVARATPPPHFTAIWGHKTKAHY